MAGHRAGHFGLYAVGGGLVWPTRLHVAHEGGTTASFSSLMNTAEGGFSKALADQLPLIGGFPPAGYLRFASTLRWQAY